jgi:hypothetical protein
MPTASYALADDALLRQCRVERCRAGGPGGQHLNRTESAVRIVHLATGVEARCQDHRERMKNQAAALARLRLRLALAQRGLAEGAWLAAQRRGRQLPVTPRSPAYALVVACALDALAVSAGDLPAAAAALGVSTTQLAKLLVADGDVRRAADGLRAGFGQGPVKA